MQNNPTTGISRRELGKRVGQAVAVSALAGIVVPAVHAEGNPTINIVLVGCGGRGTGAAQDALEGHWCAGEIGSDGGCLFGPP